MKNLQTIFWTVQQDGPTQVLVTGYYNNGYKDEDFFGSAFGPSVGEAIIEALMYEGGLTFDQAFDLGECAGTKHTGSR